MNMNLADKVKKFGSGFSHNVKQRIANYILIPAVIAGAGAAGCAPKDYVSNPNMKEYTAQIVTALENTQKGIGDQIAGNTATTKKYVDDQIAGNTATTKKYVDGQIATTQKSVVDETRKYVDDQNTKIEKARTLEQTAQNLATNKEIDARIEKSRKEINDYITGEIKTITGKLSGLEQVVNTATRDTATNKEEISKYAKQSGELKGQLDALDKTAKSIAGDTTTNKSDYTTKFEGLRTRLTALEQRLSTFLPPTFPGYYLPPIITAPPPYSATSAAEVNAALRYNLGPDLARAMYSRDPWKFQNAFPYAQAGWFNNWVQDGEIVSVGVDLLSAQAKFYLVNVFPTQPAFSIPAQTVKNVMWEFLNLNPSMVSQVTIQTLGY